MRNYRRYQLTPRDIRSGAYKELMGGGAEEWGDRGRAQLGFLIDRGLQPHHTLLDVGCGVLRGGEHLIEYLEQGNYTGIEGNPDFVKAARSILKARGWTGRATIRQTWNFDAPGGPWDFVLAFSVLNHCTEPQRKKFSRRLPGWLKTDSTAYVTHADWFDEQYLDGRPLTYRRVARDAWFEPVVELRLA